MATTKKAVIKRAVKRPAAPTTAVGLEPSDPVKAAPRASSGTTPEPVVASATGEKQKLVRDSFTMPKPEYALLAAMKQRLLQRSKAVKKSELLRAGVVTLATMSDDELLATMDRVPSLKIGRPRKQKAASKTSSV